MRELRTSLPSQNQNYLNSLVLHKCVYCDIYYNYTESNNICSLTVTYFDFHYDNLQQFSLRDRVVRVLQNDSLKYLNMSAHKHIFYEL